jgi:putative sporulation protein YyaC
MLPVSVYYEDSNASITLGEALKEVLSLNDKVLVICIGTDKYICDCLGPLVGSLLVDTRTPLHVLGVLDNPIHSSNLEIIIKEITNLFPNHKIIAIDGYLGNEQDIGLIKFKEGSVNPGAAISKNHPPIGNYVIEAIIEKEEASDHLLELPLRLRYMFKMAIIIRDAFKYACNIKDNNHEINLPRIATISTCSKQLNILHLQQ